MAGVVNGRRTVPQAGQEHHHIHSHDDSVPDSPREEIHEWMTINRKLRRLGFPSIRILPSQDLNLTSDRYVCMDLESSQSLRSSVSSLISEVDDKERIMQDLEQANSELRDEVAHLTQEAHVLSAKAKDIKVMLECSRARVQELESDKNRSSSRVSHADEKFTKTRSDLTAKCEQLKMKVAEQEKELTRLRREVIAFAQEEELRHKRQNQFYLDLKHQASGNNSAMIERIIPPGHPLDRGNHALESADSLKEILKMYEKQLQEKNKKIRLLEDQRESLKQDLRSSPDVKDHRLLTLRVKKLESLLKHHNISIPGEKTKIDPFVEKRKLNTRLEHLESLPLEQCHHYLRDLCAELQTDDLDCLVDLVRSVREEARNSDRFREYCQKLSETVESVNEHSQRHRSYGPNKDLSTILCDSNMRYYLGVIENWSKDISSLGELQDAINSLLDKVVPWIHARMDRNHSVIEMAELVERVTHADKGDRKTTLMEDVSRSTLESIVSHFQTLFEVSRISGIFPRMNEVYRQLGEYRNVHNALKSILGIPNGASPAALVDAVGKLCHRYNSSTSDQLKKLLQTDDLNSVIKRLHEHKQFFPAFKGVMDKLFEILSVSKMDEVVPAVRALKLLAS
ncbi:hypothetical protein BsWGS_09517 [Bradybaena similaris]